LYNKLTYYLLKIAKRIVKVFIAAMQSAAAHQILGGGSSAAASSAACG